jgi:hypothetical protein
MTDGVVLANVVFESKGPEASIEVGASEFGTKGIANMAMRSLNKSILMGRVCTSGENVVTKLGEQLPNGGVVKEFATICL